MMFIGGPPTSGPGAIVGKARSEDMRSHTDIAKENTPHMKAAIAHYEGVAKRAVTSNHVIDIFACSLDQFGGAEMRVCVERTGGLMVVADSFGQSVFKESFRRVFRRYPDDAHPCNAGHMTMGFAATLEVLCSARDFKVAGAIGPCSSLGKTNASVAETKIGMGGTYAWSMGGCDPSTTIALYFEVSNQQAAAAPQPGAYQQAGKKRHLQLITTYQHASGRYRMRVTSLCGGWHTTPEVKQPIASSFDQEAAAVLMARFAVYRTESEETCDILRWLDRSLIRLCAKFADYRKDDPMTFRLSPEFAIYPQFMFHLRRSNFLQVFNCSPDESTWYRMLLCRENTTNSLVMIQPSLLSYSFQGTPQPVLLDATSVRPDTILLLDTFFHVVVFHGETIASWRDQRYQDHEEHINFKNLLLAPGHDAQTIMDARFPVPRYIVCDQHKSQSRFLMAKLNPSVTHNSTDGTGEVIFTDDVSLKVFMEHLMKLSVQT
jgi:protein transport protein SEC23